MQLHCEQVFTKQGLEQNLPTLKIEGATSVSRAKQAIFSSNPTIIFCDVSLKPSESQQFNCHIEIPMNFPPSFKVNLFYFRTFCGSKILNKKYLFDKKTNLGPFREIRMEYSRSCTKC